VVGEGGRLSDDHALQIANHPLMSTCGESSRTIKLYDRTDDVITLDDRE